MNPVRGTAHCTCQLNLGPSGSSRSVLNDRPKVCCPTWSALKSPFFPRSVFFPDRSSEGEQTRLVARSELPGRLRAAHTQFWWMAAALRLSLREGSLWSQRMFGLPGACQRFWRRVELVMNTPACWPVRGEALRCNHRLQGLPCCPWW